MTDTQLHHIAGSLYRQLKKQLHLMQNEGSKEPVHQFRVAYKKLRAFLRMVGPSPTGTMPRELKFIYASAGRLRDLQLLLDELLKPENRSLCPNTFLYRARKDIRQDKKLLLGLVTHYKPANERDKIYRSLPAQFSLRSFRQYAGAKSAEVNAMLRRSFFRDGQLHHIRKCLKDLSCNTAVYKGAVHKIIFTTAWKGVTGQMLDSLMHELGLFQDKCTAIALLSQYIHSSDPAGDNDQLLSLQKKWLNEKVMLKKKLIRQLTAVIRF